jgi:hypothetical protein
MTGEIFMRDELRLFIKDLDTGKVTETLVYPKWYHKILIPFGYHHTWWLYGREHAAKLLGGLSGNIINQIGIRDTLSSWVWKSTNSTYESVGIVHTDNEANPFTVASTRTFTIIRMNNSGDTGNGHIQENIDVTLTSSTAMYCNWTTTFTVE